MGIAQSGEHRGHSDWSKIHENPKGVARRSAGERLADDKEGWLHRKIDRVDTSGDCPLFF
jgi:hypothetical protein